MTLAWRCRGNECVGKRGKLAVAFVILEHDGWNLYQADGDKPGELKGANLGSREEAMKRAEEL